MLGNARESTCEKLEMFGPPRQEQRATSRFYSAHDIGDHLVTRDIIDECGVDVLDRDLGQFRRHPELGVARSHLMLEGRCFGHRPGAHAEPYGAALHVDDRMVPILPGRSSSQAYDILGLRLPHHLFEGESGYMMALIDDHLPVLRYVFLPLVLP